MIEFQQTALILIAESFYSLGVCHVLTPDFARAPGSPSRPCKSPSRSRPRTLQKAQSTPIACASPAGPHMRSRNSGWRTHGDAWTAGPAATVLTPRFTSKAQHGSRKLSKDQRRRPANISVSCLAPPTSPGGRRTYAATARDL